MAKKTAAQQAPAAQPVPSIYDTHCEGPGLSPSTLPWSWAYTQYWRFLKDDHVQRTLPPQIDLKGKNVIITGSNSGIGKEAAYISALWGAHVILACRETTPAHEQHPEEVIEEFVTRSDGAISKSQLEHWPIDFADFATIRAFAERWNASGRTLDYLFNNAGLNISHFVETKDGFELTRQVNYLSHTLLTYLLLPSLKASKAPRIINTASSFHYGGRLNFAHDERNDIDKHGRLAEGGEWYCDSKLALTMWSKELQSRLSRSSEYNHVIVHAIHPGFVSSNVWNSGWLTKSASWKQFFINLGLRHVAIDTKQGALGMLWAAYAAERGLPKDLIAGGKDAIPDRYTETVGGRFWNRTQEAPTRPEVHDLVARARLWERTAEDIKAAKYGLDKILPGPLPGLH